MFIFRLRMITAVVVAVFALSELAVAAEQKPPKDDANDWRFTIIGYGFATGITGDAGIRRANVDVDVSFSDIMENFDLGGMGFVQAQKGPWSFILDGSYIKLSADKAFTRRGALSANIDVEMEQAIVEGFIGYRVFDDATNDLGQKVSIDLLAGARYNRLSGKLGVEASVIGITTAAQRERTIDWVDPVLGLRLQAHLTERTRLVFWGDYGGFGAGSDSTWQLLGGVGYTFSNGIDLFGGYRAYAFDYEEGSGTSRAAFDLVYSGPILGVGYKF